PREDLLAHLAPGRAERQLDDNFSRATVDVIHNDVKIAVVFDSYFLDPAGHRVPLFFHADSWGRPGNLDSGPAPPKHIRGGERLNTGEIERKRRGIGLGCPAGNALIPLAGTFGSEGNCGLLAR